jgi:uncharacterized protein DUF2608
MTTCAKTVVSAYHSGISKAASGYDIILLDIDDVIITPTQYTCSSTWYSRYHKANSNFLSNYNLIENFYKCLNTTSYEPVSKKLVKDFTEMSYNHIVIGFTARTIEFAKEALEQIASVKMSFSNNLGINHPNFFGGIIFAGYDKDTAKPNDKGLILKSILELNNLSPNGIFFIDDSERNLENVYRHFNGITNIHLVHYTEVKTRLYLEFEQEELDNMGELQFSEIKEIGRIATYEQTDICITEDFGIL